MQKKQLLFTFDYELYLGKNSGSVTNCLLIPTRKLLEILSRFQIKAIFFVDTLYLFRLKEVSVYSEEALKDYTDIKKQLTIFSEQGHYLFLHQHPHWMDAKYIPETNSWDISDSTNFSCVNFTREMINYLFGISIEILNEFVKQKYPESPLGYRAGGLFIQPFNLFYDSFKQYNIQYDFSVLRNAVLKSDNNLFFDFSKIPMEFIYHFEKDPCLLDMNGKFKEFTLNTIKIFGIWKLLNSFYYRVISGFTNDFKYGDGLPTKNASFIKFPDQKKYGKLISIESFSIENLNPVKLLLYISFLKSNSYMHWISHPKLVTRKSLNYFSDFLTTISSKTM